jgi:hypothetical protein
MTTLPTHKKYFLIMGAVLAWVAVVLQYYLMLQHRVVPVAETTARFFSFFTILTNTLIAVYFTFMLSNNSPLKTFVQRPGTGTAITVYISVVGIVYQFVLRQIWEPQGLQMIVDELLHSVIPLYFMLFWYLYEDKTKLQWAQMPYWLIYPLLYLIFILIRGSFSGFYPYPFVNVAELGMEKVMLNSLVLMVVFVGFSSFYIAIGSVIRKASIKHV